MRVGPCPRPLAQRLFLLRVEAAEALRDGPGRLVDYLEHDLGLDPSGAELLADYFQQQDQVSEIPDGGVCLIEVVPRPGGEEYYLHTPLNRLANEVLARVLVHRLARDLGRAVIPIVADLGLGLLVRGSPLAEAGGRQPSGQPEPEGHRPPPSSRSDSTASGPDLAGLFRRLLDSRNFDADLDTALASSDLLRQRFQRVAFTGLMLLRNPLGRKRKVGGQDWGERTLFEQVQARDADFVLLRQAAREIRTDWCDVRTRASMRSSYRVEPSVAAG